MGFMSETVEPTTSSAVAQILHRAGIATVPSRTREGIYVSSGNPNRRDRVTINVQIDTDQMLANATAESIRVALGQARLAFEHEQDELGCHSFRVLGRTI